VQPKLERAPYALVGTISGKYRLEAPLGKGGLGEVYKARDLILDRPVALKLLLGEPYEGSQAVDQLQREAGLAAQLNHPNAVVVHDITSFDGHAAIVMEYVAGQSLAETLAERGTLSDRDMVPVLDAVAAALDVAHERGVVHGDVKPSNVLLGDDGQVKLCDFGIARRIGSDPTAPWAGTPGYTAPEVEAGADPDPRSDVYSLGALTVTMLTGRPDNVDDLPPGYASVLRTALQPQPNVRCSRAGLLATAFRAAVERQQIVKRGRFKRLRDLFRRRKPGAPRNEREATAATVAAVADATMPMPFVDPDLTRPLDKSRADAGSESQDEDQEGASE
jgi:serine/threonine-protein kinase